jgi:integrase
MPRYDSARQLPSGRWQGRYTADGQRFSKTFDSARAANEWVRQQQEALREGEWTSPQDGQTPLSAWVAVWTAAQLDVRRSTAARDASIVANHVLPAFGDTALADLSQRDVGEWVHALSGKGLAPATVQKAYQVLTKIMTAAVDARLIRTSPCYAIKLPKIEREEMRFLTPAEVQRLTDAMPHRYKALVLLGCFGGLRIGEIAGLDRRHVELSRKRVQVAQNAVEVQGVLHVGAPKTSAGRRAVPLPATVLAALADHLDNFTADDPAAPVFTVSANAEQPLGCRLRANTFRRRVWAPAVATAGLDGLRLHDMRHTAVAFWIHAGANDLQIAKRAGHGSVNFTKDRYGHLFEDADDDLNDALDALMTPRALAAAVGDGLAVVTPIRPR